MSSPVLCQLVMCRRARWRAHTVEAMCTKRHTIHATAQKKTSVFYSSFMFQELSDCIRPLLISLSYLGRSVMTMASHSYPMESQIPTRGTARLQRFTTLLLRVHLRQSHIQAKEAFYVPSVVGGFIGKQYHGGGGWQGKNRECEGLNGGGRGHFI